MSDQDRIQKGDAVEVIDDDGTRLTLGYRHIIEEVSSSGFGRTVRLEGVTGWFWIHRFRKIEKPKVVMDAEGLRLTNIASDTVKIYVSEKTSEIKPGDWVAVQGQVLESTEDDSPGDHLIEFFSHNEQWKGWVRKDRVQPIPTPGHVEQCTAMTVNVMDTNVYYRCEKSDHRRFDRHHKSGSFEWLENDTSGYIEEC